MKNFKTLLNTILFSLIVTFSLTGCNADDKSSPTESGSTQFQSILSDGDSDALIQSDEATLTAYANSKKVVYVDLSDSLTDGLVKMREEEKLARDVYTYLYTKWNRIVFKNITRSEQVHMNAVKLLLDSYSIPDPVGTNGYGVFTNPVFTQLYQDLTTRGEVSLIEALKVGGAIEEIDLLDLKHELLISAGFPDVNLVFTNLSKASVRHLKAYVFNLKMQGVIYTPQFMTQEEYNEIMNS